MSNKLKVLIGCICISLIIYALVCLANNKFHPHYWAMLDRVFLVLIAIPPIVGILIYISYEEKI
jgi:hypothetical protein